MKEFSRKIYNLIPFKGFAFNAIRRVWIPNRNIYKHLHFDGVFSIPVDGDNSIKMHHYGFELENEIFWSGLENGWESTSINIWKQLVQTSNVILDVGANTGVYSLIARALNPSAKILALEPIRRVFLKLEKNIHLNSFDIVAIEAAASDNDGTATVYDLPTDHIYSVTVNKNLNSPTANVIPTEIRTVRLDSLLSEQRIESVDLIKLDVETHEPEVLSGLGELLVIHRPTLLIEILNEDVGKRVESLITNLDYLYFNIDEGSNSIRPESSITKSDYYNYLVCTREVATQLKLI